MPAFFKYNFMQSKNILFSSIIGTSAMTLFSYLISESENKNFREPEVLARLIKRLPGSSSEETAQIAGWGMHYTIGFLFVVIYSELWKHKNIDSAVTSGILLGTASGFTGILAWKAMFEIHPDPPAKDLKDYFRHLLLAHVVFGVFSALAFKLLSDEENS